jgi:hypothetical protein
MKYIYLSSGALFENEKLAFKLGRSVKWKRAIMKEVKI